MNSSQIVRGLRAVIPGGISVEDFRIVSETDKNTARSILRNFAENGIGKLQDDVINFGSGDKLKAAIFAIKQGASVDQVSANLEWKDFEGLVSTILETKGFGVIRNLTLTKPRMEIDVIGIKLGVALLIDCKHWKRQSYSTLKAAVEKQVERVKHYVSKTKGAVAVPAIVTLYQEELSFIDKVPIVPILQFSSFVDELYGNLDEVSTIGIR